MLQAHVLAHLKAELAKSDPWHLQGSDFEQRRYDAIIAMLGIGTRFQSGLEIGCAAGEFTRRLAECCVSLRVVDVLPEAVDRCRARLKNFSAVHYSVGDVSETVGWNETYDLVVVNEVLYYLGSLRAIRETIAQLHPLVRPGGIVVFGSAVNAVVRRWGLRHGAESATHEWSALFREVERRVCAGRSPDEHALVVKYTRDA